MNGNNELRQMLHDRRVSLGLTMREVAEHCGVSEATVSRWESGNIGNMKRSRIALLAEILQIPPTAIIGDYKPPKERETITQLVNLIKQLDDDEINNIIDYATFIANKKAPMIHGIHSLHLQNSITWMISHVKESWVTSPKT